MDLFTVLLGLSGILLTFLYLQRRHKSSYPPCPMWPLPIVGHFPFLKRDPREQFAEFRKKCGDIYSLYLGGTQVIMINGYELAKEALVKRGDEFSERATIFADLAANTAGMGIVASNGNRWKENRDVTINILKNFGMGKNILAQKVQEEVDHYLELLESFHGEPRDVREITQVSMANIICSVIVGHRFDHNDEKFRKLLFYLIDAIENIEGTTLLNYLPSLRFLPGDLFNAKRILRQLQYFTKAFVNEHFDENKDVTGEPENYIAAYLKEMRQGRTAHLDEPNLLRCIADLFAGGSEPTSSTFLWLMLFLVNHPHVQEKIFKEMEDEIGLEVTPAMKDKPRLPYLSATIMEAQRMANLTPILLPRVITKDTTLGGYTLPKGAQFMVNPTSVFYDKTLWGEDADEFRPERFLDKDGKLLSPPEYWIPFSHGRRVCPGKGMAKMELFLFIANIIQKFKILPADENKLPPIKGRFGATYTPLPYQIRFIKRK